MVTAFQMSILMGNNIGQLCFICPGGNVDARFEETKNKRCLYIVTNPNTTERPMTTPLFLLRAVEFGLSVSDLSLLTIGLVNDMFTEKNNDEYKYKEVATQEDFDKF